MNDLDNTYLFLTRIFMCKPWTISQSNTSDGSVCNTSSWEIVLIFFWKMLYKMYVLIKPILRQYIIFSDAFSARCCKLEREVNLWPWFEIGKHLDCFWIRPPTWLCTFFIFHHQKTTSPYCVYFTNRLDSRFKGLFVTTICVIKCFVLTNYLTLYS